MKRIRTLSTAALLCALMAVWCRPAVAGPVELAPRFETGMAVQYVTKSVIEHHVRVELADVDETVNVRTESGMNLRVDEVDSNGTARVLWTLEYIVIKTDGALPGIDASLDYDSRKPAGSTSPFASMFSRLVNHPVAVRVSRGGLVESFEAPDTGGGINPLAGLTQGFFSKEAFEQLPLLVTAGAPSPAKVRSKWSRQMNIQMPLGVGSLAMSQDLKFSRMRPRQGFAQIQMAGTIKKGAPAAAPAGSGGGALLALADNLKVNKGKTRGNFLWDFVNGQLVSGETWMVLETTLNSTLGVMQLDQKMSSSVKRVEPERPRRRPREKKPRLPTRDRGSSGK